LESGVGRGRKEMRQWVGEMERFESDQWEGRERGKTEPEGEGKV